MPFIDIFSLLCTFLLFSAVFISIGIHTVQVPFLSNANDSSAKDTEVKREMDLSLEISSDVIQLFTVWSRKPINKESYEFDMTDEGIAELHDTLVDIKRENNAGEKIKVFVDDDVSYESITQVLDSIVSLESDDNNLVKNNEKISKLFPKIILSSVLL